MRYLLLILLAAQPLHAHSGEMAVAVPVEGIVIDGDLADWPQEARAGMI